MRVNLDGDHVHEYVHECEPAAHPEENSQVRLRSRLLVNHVLVDVELNLNPVLRLCDREVIELRGPVRLVFKHRPVLEAILTEVKHFLDMELIRHILVTLHSHARRLWQAIQEWNPVQVSSLLRLFDSLLLKVDVLTVRQ